MVLESSLSMQGAAYDYLLESKLREHYGLTPMKLKSTFLGITATSVSKLDADTGQRFTDPTGLLTAACGQKKSSCHQLWLQLA